ncbi:MAG: TonB-dependent receptor [Bacteroidales bacterium]|nr:TonB-dependent receptor [Candidatus Scybalousia scybalohippi]
MFCLFAVCVANIYAQNGKSSITGKVSDAKSKEMLPYVAVAVLQTKDSSIIDGGITNENGEFTISNIKYGEYILHYTFVGYKDYFKNIKVSIPTTNVGSIEMTVSSSNLNEVKVVGAKQMMEYKLDKRVINVDQNLTAAGGDASDVLQDVPSVEIDDEGNISLRGGSNVTLLIDGKPSDIYGSNVASVLAQIPASSIDKIEVITNPSARYNPEGMSGIINITLKEKGNRGLNGNINISAGSALNKWMPRDNISGALNWSNKKVSLSASANVRYGEMGMLTDNMRYFRNSSGYVTDIMRTQRDGGTDGYGYGFRLGAEWYINKFNTMNLSLNINKNKDFNDYSTATNTNYLNSSSIRNNVDISNGYGRGSFNNMAFTYEKTFKDNEDQLFYANLTWSWGSYGRTIEDEIIYNSPLFSDRNYIRGDTTISRRHNAVADIHYIHPFSKNSKMEIGYNLNFTIANNNYEYSYDRVLDNATSYDFHKTEQIHAIYATYGWQVNDKLSTQVGLRGETTLLDFSKDGYNGIKTTFDRDYSSLYPSIHISYQINKMNSFQISYSRRVKRPDHFNMMPNVDMTNQEYLRFGNPKLDPEYTDAYEFGYSLLLKNTTIFTSLYYREVSNAITRFEFEWNEDNALYYGFDWAWQVAGSATATGRTAQSFLNIANSRNYGLEIIVDRDITSWWKANLSMNFFGAYKDGRAYNYDKVNAFNFNTKLNTTITLPKNWSIQASGRYTAPSRTIQGWEYSRYDVDIAIKKSIWERRGSIGINFRDILDSRGGHGIAYTDEYISFNNRHPYSRSIRLSFSYNFGKVANMKKKKAKSMQENYNTSGGDEDEDEE